MIGTTGPLTDLSSLTELPLLGPAVAYADRMAVELGMPPWLRRVAELVLLGLVAFLALRLVVRRIVR
ncbi:MAG TPA: hypothetical protein VGJ13_15235 [Pseudonocardiaceae bacterium]